MTAAIGYWSPNWGRPWPCDAPPDPSFVCDLCGSHEDGLPAPLGPVEVYVPAAGDVYRNLDVCRCCAQRIEDVADRAEFCAEFGEGPAVAPVALDPVTWAVSMPTPRPYGHPDLTDPEGSRPVGAVAA